MKTKLLLLLVLLFATAHASMAFQASQDHKVLFEKAKYTMETKGDLEGAITLFEELINTYPNEKEYAANAQFHIGLCYEKLGLKQAQEAYQKVLDNYPEQEQEIALAKERLNRLLALQEVTPEPTFRKIQIPTKLSWNMALSPDGQKLLLVSDSMLWVMPITGNLGEGFPGKPVPISTGDVDVEWTGLSWSRDGKWIAFNEVPLEDTLVQKKENQSIYVVPSEGGSPTKVLDNHRSGRVVNYKLSLSPHGKLLAFSSIENGVQHIQTISVEGGDPKRLTDMQAREPVFSPDGKLIAFVEDKNLGIAGGGLWVLPASGGQPTLVAKAGKASSPVWSPDGTNIAYVDFNESKKIFVIPVNQEGKKAGEKIAINVPEGISDVRLLAGWNPDNKIGALMVRQVEFAVYTLPEQGGQAALVVHGGRPAQPRWTANGKHIIFMKMARENPLPPNHAIAIVPAEGGENRNILLGSEDSLFVMPYQAGVRVSPDGEKIVMAAKRWNEIGLVSNYPTLQIFTTTIEGDNPVKITNPASPFTDISPCWSPDGKSIAFLRVKLLEGQMDMFGEIGIYTVSSSEGEPKLLASEFNKWVNSLNWSPDGQWIAYFSTEKKSPYENSLHAINMENGESTLIGKMPQVNVHSEIAWSPDSKRIAFTDAEGKVVKTISLDDGTIKDIETGLVNTTIYHLDWSPDGKRFVFAGYKGGDKEFWLVENFLPENQ